VKRYRGLHELPDSVQQVVQRGQRKATGLLCPECQGGQSREGSLGVYVIGHELIIKCYRIKCGHLGKLLLSGDDVPLDAGTGFEPRPFLGDLHGMTGPAFNFLYGRYSLEAGTLDNFGVREVLGLNAVYLPVYGPRDSDRGGVVRRFDEWGKKADSYKTADEPWQAWYSRLDFGKGTVLVEDQLSAMRAWQRGWNAVALLGAEVSEDRSAELTKSARRPIVLALDADAFPAACQAAKRHNWIDKVVLLKHDIKDSTDSEIEVRLG
jgi:hypothetical protein